MSAAPLVQAIVRRPHSSSRRPANRSVVPGIVAIVSFPNYPLGITEPSGYW
jgi:hypothetical protein